MVKKNRKTIFNVFFLTLIFAVIGTSQVSNVAVASSKPSSEFNASEVILHHVVDDYSYHLFDGKYGTLYLPVILYSQSNGFDVFSSSNFYDTAHNSKPYKGYKLNHGKIQKMSNSDDFFLDLSITKTVLMLFVNATLLLVVFFIVAKRYKNNPNESPKGMQSFFEPVIIFLRDEVAKPNIGNNYNKYMPFLLSLFFFILFGNLLGLIPGAANLTGNISVTLVLAFFTFVVTNVNGNKNYWKHIFVAPGVPIILKPLIVLVEFIGIFTKPISLTVRLFVAITAGHIVMLALICLTFIFRSYMVGVGSTIIVLFISSIELLVAAIQAYVFTMFSALYIGMAIEEHH